MSDLFPYNKFVTGKHFFGRGAEVRALTGMLGRGVNLFLAEAPKTGKRSLIRQGFLEMVQSGQPFAPVQLSLLDIRTAADFARNLKEAVLQPEGDPGAPSADDTDPLREACLLPYRIGARTGVRRIVVLEEFQNIRQDGDGDLVCNTLAEVFASLPAELAGAAAYIFLGSRPNAMRELMDRTRLGRYVERLRLDPLPVKEIVEHVVRGFLATGKVVDPALVQDVCRTLRCHIWYINHLCAICDTLTRGYITEAMIRESLESLVSIHEPRFLAMTDDLTSFQISMLRAVLDGHARISSAEVIQHYRLNSSANVRRVKDALCKKEIISFDRMDGAPVLQDPLYEYWLRKSYFKISEL